MAVIEMGLDKKEVNITSKDRAYKLQYRFQNRFTKATGRVQEKVFWFKGNLKEANIRSRKHCEVMDYMFIYCYPYIVDLDAQEELKLKDKDGSMMDQEEY